MRFPSYIHDAAPLNDREILVLRANPDNLKPGLLERWDVIAGTRQYEASAGAPLAFVLAVRGGLAATGDTGGALRIWNTDDGTCVRTIGARVGALAFLDDDRLIGSSMTGFDIWDVRNGQRVRSVPIDRGGVRGFAVTPGSDQIIAACEDRFVHVWETAGGACIRSIFQPGLPPFVPHLDAQDPHAATDVAIIPGTDHVVASYGDGSLRRWDLSNGALVCATRAPGDGPSWLLSVDVSPSGDRVITGSWDSNVYAWDFENDPVSMSGHIGEAGPVFFLGDSHAVSVSFDQTIRVWDVARATCERVIGKPIESRRFPPTESLW